MYLPLSQQCQDIYQSECHVYTLYTCIKHLIAPCPYQNMVLIVFLNIFMIYSIYTVKCTNLKYMAIKQFPAAAAAAAKSFQSCRTLGDPIDGSP